MWAACRRAAHRSRAGARDRLREQGLETSYLRLRALPINGEVRRFVEKYDRVYVVENNRDGQLHEILLVELHDLGNRMISVSKCDGLPLSARWITEQIANQEGMQK